MKTALILNKNKQNLKKQDTKPLEVVEKDSIVVGNDLQFVREKKAYRTFIKLIKTNKFTTAVIASQITGVSRQTISKWLQTNKVLSAMNSTVNRYVERIEESKDWKAQAYLLDKVVGTEKEKDKSFDLTNLISIQIVK